MLWHTFECASVTNDVLGFFYFSLAQFVGVHGEEKKNIIRNNKNNFIFYANMKEIANNCGNGWSKTIVYFTEANEHKKKTRRKSESLKLDAKQR